MIYIYNIYKERERERERRRSLSFDFSVVQPSIRRGRARYILR